MTMTKLNKAERLDAVERLVEIREEIEELVHEAYDLVKSCDEDEARRADAYWRAHIITALSNDHGYLGGSMATLQDSIDAIENDEEDDD